MKIALEKRKKNIAEYLLYMWTLEDMLRASAFDTEKLMQALGENTAKTEAEYTQIKNWYNGLVEMMDAERVKQSGHLQINKNTLIDLTDLHTRLLGAPEYADYQQVFSKNFSLIEHFRQLVPGSVSEIEACFTALYSQMLLKLQKRNISEGTADAFQQFSALLGLLSKYYHQRENGEIEL